MLLPALVLVLQNSIENCPLEGGAISSNIKQNAVSNLPCQSVCNKKYNSFYFSGSVNMSHIPRAQLYKKDWKTLLRQVYLKHID